MATITSTNLVNLAHHASFKRSIHFPATPILKMQRTTSRSRTIMCSSKENKAETSCGIPKAIMFGAVAAATAAIVAMTGPAKALVDERLSTEGTGLPFGLSNNLLGWILLGVFGLIWSFYIVYTSTLDEDEDSGLSL